MEEASRFRVVTEIENDDVLIVFARELQNEITLPYLAQAFDDKRFMPGRLLPFKKLLISFAFRRN